MLKNVGYWILLDVSHRTKNNKTRGHSHELSIYHSNAFKLRPVVMNYPKVHWIFLWSPTDANMANVFLQRSRNYINDLSCTDYVTPNYVIKKS